MRLPPAVAFRGREKWVEVALDAALVVLGAVLVLGAAPLLSGWEPVGLLVLVAYTVWAMAATVVLACAAAATSQLPTLDETMVDGERVVAVRSWGAPWWHTVLLDLGLAVAGLGLALAVAGGSWGVLAAIPALAGLWFLVRVGLVVAGRRRRPGLLLTGDELVVDGRGGRARVGRAGVRRVGARGRRLVVALDHDAEWALCPRLWRSASARCDVLVLDCTEIGHTAEDLAVWLGAELAAEPELASDRGREVRRAPGRA